MTKPHEDSLQYLATAAAGWAIAVVSIGAIIFTFIAGVAGGTKLIIAGGGIAGVVLGIWLVRRVDDNIFRALMNALFAGTGF